MFLVSHTVSEVSGTNGFVIPVAYNIDDTPKNAGGVFAYKTSL